MEGFHQEEQYFEEVPFYLNNVNFQSPYMLAVVIGVITGTVTFPYLFGHFMSVSFNGNITVNWLDSRFLAITRSLQR